MTLKHILGTVPVIKILDFLVEHQRFDHTKKDIIEGADIGPTDMKRDFPGLIECGVVVETRRIGGVSLYSLDPNSEMTLSLISLDYDLTEYCAEKMSADYDEHDEEYGCGLPEPED